MSVQAQLIGHVETEAAQREDAHQQAGDLRQQAVAATSLCAAPEQVPEAINDTTVVAVRRAIAHGDDADRQAVESMSSGSAPDEAFAGNAAFAAQPGPQDAFARVRAPHGRTQRHPFSVSQANASPLAHRLGRLAVGALHAELTCAPKPGLVTPFDTGSHTDMDASTFLRSLFALRGYFVAVAQAGINNAPFERLRRLGIDAEIAMLHATGGVNTHRGAIFSLGLLTAQAARLRAAHGQRLSGEAVCKGVRLWRDALHAVPLNPHSHGQRVRTQYQISGVREQAAAGYPLLHEIALPCLRAALNNGATQDAALAQTLMHLVAEVDDLTVLHRGGRAGLAYAKAQARAFLADGGITQPQWCERLGLVGRRFVARRLSPGGSADLLACAWFLHRQETA